MDQPIEVAQTRTIMEGSSSSENSLKKDSIPEMQDETILKDYPMRKFKISLPGSIGVISFNPLTSFLGMASLWGLAAWCMARPDESKKAILKAKSQVTLHFTWLYILSRPIFVFFLVYIAVKYGNIRLGPKNSRPEFSDMSYFAMLFSAGVAVGLFFYGVSEPLWYASDNWYANQDSRSQDEIDLWAINQSLYHWGFAAWGSYITVAIAQALGTFRFGLPMTFRSSFYPLLGHYTWGVWGDVIDSFTIVTTVAGICTSLGLGTFQIVAGLQRLGWINNELVQSEETKVQSIIVWVITCIATCSVISGLNVGIKYLSMVGFSLGMVLLVTVITLEKSNYILNLIVQSTGYYFQWSSFQTNFWTDAFGQLKSGEGRAIDGQAAPAWFMDAWTVFYMAWWQAWSAFVGMFIARISKGRTIREVILFSFVAPFFYAVIWFCTFGGAGLRQNRQAMELEVLGQNYFQDKDYFLADGSTYCYDVPQKDVLNVAGNKTIFSNTLLGVTPVCKFNSAESTQAWFNVLYSFSFPDDGIEQFGAFLSAFSIVAVSIYFITSSDSGSLVVDYIASNGQLDHHWIQRLFWAFTEGGVATALLHAGGSDALSAVQAASIIFGLPFTVLVLLFCQSILRMCDKCVELGESDDIQEFELPKTFSMNVFGGMLNWVEYIASLGNVHPERVSLRMDKPTGFQSSQFFVAIFLPFIPLNKALTKVYPKQSESTYVIIMTVIYAILFVGWIALFASSAKSYLFVSWGAMAFISNGMLLAHLRKTVRQRHKLAGDWMADLFASSFLYFQVITQIIVEEDMHKEEHKEVKDETIDL